MRGLTPHPWVQLRKISISKFSGDAAGIGYWIEGVRRLGKVFKHNSCCCHAIALKVLIAEKFKPQKTNNVSEFLFKEHRGLT